MNRNDYLTLTAMFQSAFARHGTTPVIAAALAAAFLSPRPDLKSTDALGDHLRRDVGLPPAEPSRHYTEYMR